MLRYRLASMALAAGLGLLSGCMNTNPCSEPGIGRGQLLSRLGLGRHKNTPCECSTVGSGPIYRDGATGFEGPYLEDPNAIPGAIPGGIPTGPMPRIVPQAQPVPAPATQMSKTK